MLETFRKASRSWFIKILFGLLIVSFIVFFGNSNELLQLSSSRPAIKVGSQEISAGTVADTFRRDVERLQSMFGTRFTLEQAREMGLLQQSIQQIVSRALLAEEANRLGFTVDDDSLRQMIASTPAFQNQLGVFDKTVYQQVLARAGLTEAAFIKLSRDDTTRQDLARMVQSGLVIPKAEAEDLFRYRFEQRTAELVSIPLSSIAAPAKPAPEILEAYWKANPDRFTQPETRGFSAVVVTLADAAAGVTPSEQDIETAYRVRQTEFVTPETRALRQVMFDDEAKARAFADKAKTPAAFADAAKAAKAGVIDLGRVERAALPFPELAEAAFSQPKPGLAGPVKSPLGWHVLAVDAIEAEHARPLAEVRKDIVAALVQEEATNRLFSLSTKLEDAVGAGAPIEEAAQELGVQPLKVEAADRRGLDLAGKAVAGLPVSDSFRQVLFQTPKGATSEVKPLEGDGGYFVIRVDAVTPSQIRPLESVSGEVLAAWSTEERFKAARAQGDALKERLEKGEAVGPLAKGLTLATSQPFRRQPDPATGEGAAPEVPPALAALLFKVPIGGAAVAEADGKVVVGRVKSVVPAEPRADDPLFQRTRQQLSQSLAQDVMQQYLQALNKDFGVAIHQVQIERQIGGGAQ